MCLPEFDVIFGLAAPAINILKEDMGIARAQIADDEACVEPVRAGFDADNDALDTAPAIGAVVKLLEASHLAFLGRSLEARFRAGLKALDVASQCLRSHLKMRGFVSSEACGWRILTQAAIGI